MQGLAAVALSKTFLTAASEEPIYLFSNSGPLTVIHDKPNSDATADANSVLPHPGNPYNKILLISYNMFTQIYI
jgi:hypothetical protein